MSGFTAILAPWLAVLTAAGVLAFLGGLAFAAGLALHRHLRDRRRHELLRPEDVRRRLLALAARPDLPALGPWPPVDELADLVEETASVVRGDLRVRLCERARELGVLDLLVRRSRARRVSLRERAARALGTFLELDPPAVRAVLLRLLDDREGAVRIAAAESLLGDGGDLPRHVAAHLRHDPAFATAAALRAFERLVPRLPGEAAAILADAADPRARLVAEAVARMRVHALLPAILAAFPRSRGDLRLALVRALVALDHPQGFAALERLATDPDPLVRLAALAVAAAEPGARIAPLVRRRLSDPDPRVAFRAFVLAADLGLLSAAEAAGRAA